MTLQEIRLEQERMQRRERAHALFCSMRPWIRREGWLPTVNVRNTQVAVAAK
jgi:hypothetical protein